LGRASDAVMGSPSDVRRVKFTVWALSLPRRPRILFVAAPEQRCIFATLGDASTSAARQMASKRVVHTCHAARNVH
jgi:hypothetical protein